ncbi:hypothetical protein Q7O_002848 [Pectobacterium carotovorum subsp. carotovorum PCCS1]|nr:hypothetical protein [Pectobacterium carotovorum subsp. carotovorum PCCS1]
MQSKNQFLFCFLLIFSFIVNLLFKIIILVWKSHRIDKKTRPIIE